jgi:hypothetical protein
MLVFVNYFSAVFDNILIKQFLSFFLAGGAGLGQKFDSELILFLKFYDLFPSAIKQ